MDPTSSPYSAPTSEVADRVDNQSGRPVVGVIAGIAIDLIGTILVGAGIGIIYATVLALRGYDEAAITQALSSVDDPVFTAITSILGGAVSVLAGYWCARIGKQRIYLLGIIQATLTTALVSMLMLPSSWFEALLTLASFAAILFGCYLWQRGNRSSSINSDRHDRPEQSLR